MGGDYGSFVDYIFEDLSKDFEEYTSIGYPANFACKLQTIADAGEIIISKRIYDRVPSLNRTTIKPIDSSRQNKIYSKYPDLGNVAYIVKSSERNDFYNNLNESFLFESINNKRIDYQHYFDVATAIADKTNIGDMDVIEPNKLDFKNWNIRKSAKFNAAVVFADVRDFTRKFNSDGSNLNSMSTITKNVLGCMYSNCKKNFGVHVQFQGDREFAFFDGDSIQFAVLFALRLRSEISKLCDGIEVGIGINYGQVYASQIGIESEENNIEKQNIMLGETIKEANKLEDECANKGEVVISNAVYNLVSSNRNIKSLFTKRDYYWVTKSTFVDYSKLSTNSEYNKNRNQSTYKPWNQR